MSESKHTELSEAECDRIAERAWKALGFGRDIYLSIPKLSRVLKEERLARSAISLATGKDQ